MLFAVASGFEHKIQTKVERFALRGVPVAARPEPPAMITQKLRASVGPRPYVPPLSYGNDSTISRTATENGPRRKNLRAALRCDVLGRGPLDGGGQSAQL